jgi:hypothetical protein
VRPLVKAGTLILGACLAATLASCATQPYQRPVSGPTSTARFLPQLPGLTAHVASDEKCSSVGQIPYDDLDRDLPVAADKELLVRMKYQLTSGAVGGSCQIWFAFMPQAGERYWIEFTGDVLRCGAVVNRVDGRGIRLAPERSLRKLDRAPSCAIP